MKLTDELLEQAVRQSRNEILAEIPQELPVHEFSLGFEKKMAKLMKRGRQTPLERRLVKFLRPAAALALVAVVSLAVWSTDALREPPSGVAVVQEEQGYGAAVAVHDGPKGRSAELPAADAYALAVPEGFELKENTVTDGVTVLTYEKDSENGIVFTYPAVSPDQTASVGDSAKAVTVGDGEGTLSLQDHTYQLLWNNGQVWLKLTVRSGDDSLGEREVLKLAESVQPLF